MKSLKSLVSTSVLVAGLAGSAFANTAQVVYIAGAPAYRQDINASITKYVASFTGNGGGITATNGNSTSATDVANASANQWLIPSGVSPGVDLEINVSLTGSTAGFESVASGATPLQQKFIADATGSIANPVVTTTSTKYQPNFTLSDTFQSTSGFLGSKTIFEGPNSTSPLTETYATLTPNILGVEAYKFVASPGAQAAGLTNITTAQAQALFLNGALPLSFFTGKNSDESTLVYALTRDGGSGSRLVAETELGLGTAATLTTYQPVVTGGAADTQGNFVGGTVSDTTGNITVAPAEQVPSTLAWAVKGNSGYAKFGTPSGPTQEQGLLLAITSTPPAKTLFVTYLNVPDGDEAKLAGAQELTYNGVSYSNAAVYEGQYSFWSYEQLFAPSNISGNAASVATYLENNWSASIPYQNLNVGKSADGSLITFGSDY